MSGFVEETPLAHACARGFLNIVKLLINSEVDVNFKCSVSYPVDDVDVLVYDLLCAI